LHWRFSPLAFGGSLIYLVRDKRRRVHRDMNSGVMDPLNSAAICAGPSYSELNTTPQNSWRPDIFFRQDPQLNSAPELTPLWVRRSKNNAAFVSGPHQTKPHGRFNHDPPSVNKRAWSSRVLPRTEYNRYSPLRRTSRLTHSSVG
jgi:hypothetical protein